MCKKEPNCMIRTRHFRQKSSRFGMGFRVLSQQLEKDLQSISAKRSPLSKGARFGAEQNLEQVKVVPLQLLLEVVWIEGLALGLSASTTPACKCSRAHGITLRFCTASQKSRILHLDKQVIENADVGCCWVHSIL